MQAARRGRPELAPLAAAALAFSGLLLAAPVAPYFLIDADHGLQLAGALQVSLGRHPFLDFQTAPYGPLVCYASYLGQLLSGWRLAGEVAVVLLGYAAGYAVLFALLRRVLGGPARWQRAREAVVWMLCAAFVSLVPRFYKYYLVLGPACFLLALHGATHAPGRASRPLLALAIATLALYRFDFGAFAAGAAALALLFAPRPPGGRARLTRLASLAALAGWGLLWTSPWLLFLGVRGDLMAIARDTLAAALGEATGMGLPVPSLSLEAGLLSAPNRFLLAFAELHLLPALALLVLARGWRRIAPGERAFVLAVVLFAGLTLLQVHHRAAVPHLLQVLPAVVTLLAWLVGRAFEAGRPAVALLACAAGLGPLLLVRPPELGLAGRALADFPEKLRGYGQPPAALRDPSRLKPLSWQRSAAAAADFVHQATTPETGVLFLPVFPQLYYVAERGFTSSAGWVSPGRPGGEAATRRFLASLASTRVVVDLPAHEIDDDPSRNLRAYAPVVARHLYTRYGVLRRIGWLYVLSDDPALFAAYGEFPARFERLGYAAEVRHEEPPCALRAISTLAPSADPLPVLHGSGLALHCRPRVAADAPHLELGLARGGSSFAARPRAFGTRLVSLGEGGFEVETFAATSDLEPAEYEVVVLESDPAAQRLLAFETGARVRLEPAPGLAGAGGRGP